MVLFAGSGFVQCPLTTDYGAFRLFLDAAGPDQVSTPGTDVSAALDAAIQGFGAARPSTDSTTAPDEERPRALLIVSDGENHVGDLATVRQRAEEAGVNVFLAGHYATETFGVRALQDRLNAWGLDTTFIDWPPA